MKATFAAALLAVGLGAVGYSYLQAGEGKDEGGCCGMSDQCPMADKAAPACHKDHAPTSAPASAPADKSSAAAGSTVFLADAPATTTAPSVVDVGNTKCPVMHEDVNKTDTVTYQGKLYHLCCDDCIKAFNKNPEKYVKAMEAHPEKYGIKK